MYRIKHRDTLLAAYDDAAAMTAACNLNLLHRINRELGGTVPVAAFRHQARWNDGAARIEMHLVADRDVAFEVAGDRFAMEEGETIHTENSHKYAARDARLLLRAGGWTPLSEWADPDGRFAVFLAEARAQERAP